MAVSRPRRERRLGAPIFRLEPIGAVQVRAINLSSSQRPDCAGGRYDAHTKCVVRELRMSALLLIVPTFAIQVEPIAVRKSRTLADVAQPTLLPKRVSFRQDALTLLLPMGPVSPREKPDRNLLDVPPVAAPAAFRPSRRKQPNLVVAYCRTVIEAGKSRRQFDRFRRQARPKPSLIRSASIRAACCCSTARPGETNRGISASRLAGRRRRPAASARRIPSRMRDEKRTFWHAPGGRRGAERANIV